MRRVNVRIARWVACGCGVAAWMSVLGCASVGEVCRLGWPAISNETPQDAVSVELADALERAERRSQARLGQEEASRLSWEPTHRAVTPREVAMAKGLVRQSDRVLDALDRVASIRNGDPTRQAYLARALALQATRSYADGDAGAPLRTDFLRSPGNDGVDGEYLTLSEMGEAPSGQDAATSPSGVAETSDREPLPGFGQTVWRDVKSTPRELWDDTKRVYWSATNAIILVTAGGVSVALRPEVDDDIEDYYDDHHTLSEGWRETFGVLGNPAFHFALAGAWYLAGQQMQDTKTYQVAKTMFSALIINGVSTSVLKLCANTDGPNGESFAWPSGHTSSAFTMAAVMHQAYGPWVGLPLYGVAGMVGLARLDDREHHFSDVVFGAAMGLVIGHTVGGGRRPQMLGGDLIPYIDPATGAGGLAWFKAVK
ncbi:MAG: phosphatase PAP2 family protein [Phycisphaerae bacterium]|nr:phosphatase PAP2 family protein [Phycisphaerae bacterium]